jgi:hypothetical protein
MAGKNCVKTELHIHIASSRGGSRNRNPDSNHDKAIQLKLREESTNETERKEEMPITSSLEPFYL